MTRFHAIIIDQLPMTIHASGTAPEEGAWFLTCHDGRYQVSPVKYHGRRAILCGQPLLIRDFLKLPVGAGGELQQGTRTFVTPDLTTFRARLHERLTWSAARQQTEIKQLRQAAQQQDQRDYPRLYQLLKAPPQASRNLVCSALHEALPDLLEQDIHISGGAGYQPYRYPPGHRHYHCWITRPTGVHYTLSHTFPRINPCESAVVIAVPDPTLPFPQCRPELYPVQARPIPNDSGALRAMLNSIGAGA